MTVNFGKCHVEYLRTKAVITFCITDNFHHRGISDEALAMRALGMVLRHDVFRPDVGGRGVGQDPGSDHEG